MQFVTKSTLADRDVHPAVVAWRCAPADGQHGSAEPRVAAPRIGDVVNVSPKTRPAGVALVGGSRSAMRAPGELALRRWCGAGRVNARRPQRKVRTRCKRVRSTVGCVGTRAVARRASRPSGDDRSQAATTADDPPTWHGTKRSASAGTCNEQLLLSFSAARTSAAAGVPSRQGLAAPARRSGSAGGVRGEDSRGGADMRTIAVEWAERTAREQGLPVKIEDEATLRVVATLLCAGRYEPGDQTRHAGLSRPGSKRFRPRTAAPTST